ncbi:MAG: hypothetical protein IT160_03795 [Bryobacterales bacterium]|nr:hypothetical protein [Bryobacterales bacterium]
MDRLLARCLALTLLAPLLFYAATQAPSATVSADSTRPPSQAEITEILHELTAITGLKAEHPVASAIMSRADLKQYLAEKIRQEVKPEQIHAEEVTLKKFGFVPPDFDLKATTIELLTEQAAAFYDFKKKTLYLLSGASDVAQYPALVHELAHALADQHFNLDRFIGRASQDDGELARMAVMEGQATWLMMEATSRKMGFSLATNPESGDFFASQVAALSAGQFPVFDKSPLYMRETLLFPYVSGMKFQNAVYHKIGKSSFTEVFKRPPVSTQQILHPLLYFDHVEPVRIKAPAIEDASDYRQLAEGVVGELDYSILLRQYTDQETAASIAPHWKGSQYRVWEHKKDQSTVLSCAVQWDSADIAAQFLDAYRKVMQSKWKTFRVASETAGAIRGTGDDGYFLVHVDGPRVEFQQGLKNPPRAE